MRILQAPINIAGQPLAVSRAQRKLGYKSDLLILKNDFSKRPCDINLHMEKGNRVWRAFKFIGNFFRCLFYYDIFHFHYGQTLLPYNFDLPILRFFKKKTLMQYWGTDIIQFDLAKTRTEYDPEELAQIFHEQDDNQKRKKIAQMEKKIDVSVIGDYALKIYSPKSKIIPIALDLEEVEYVGVKTTPHQLKIVHAPSNRLVKGTDHILSMLAKLKNDGFDFEIVLVENKSNQEALEIYKNADLVIDDIMQGPYGILCMEAMALGKPVMCHIDASLIPHYPGLPIVNVSPKNLYQKIKEILLNQELRVKLGERGRAYMEAHHDIMKTAQQFIDLYKQL